MEIQNLMSASIIVGAATASSVPEKETDTAATASSTQQAAAPTEAPETQSLALDASAETQQEQDGEQDGQGKEQGKMNEESVSMLTKELNELMENINCDLQFKYNKEVNVMTVKMVDKKTDEVLREYPPEEMVQNMIKAREWIGAFLDRQA